MRKKISEIKENNENFNFDISCGVSTGYAVVGNIGSSKHKEYTVIGDSVNTAARLQGFAKDNQIIIDYDTYIKANEKNEFKFNDIGEIKVKGKEKKIKVYEILE
jgi:adenylate cyclase